MRLSEVEAVVCMRAIVDWVTQHKQRFPLRKRNLVVKYWQQSLTIQVHLNRHWTLEIYSPNSIPTVDVYIDGVFEYHRSSEIRLILEKIHTQFTPPST